MKAINSKNNILYILHILLFDTLLWEKKEKQRDRNEGFEGGQDFSCR